MTRPTALDVYAARRRLQPRLQVTPLRKSWWLSDASGGDVWLKLESLNATGSFKIRGAFNSLLALVDEAGSVTRSPLIVTASAGNHGQAIALAAAELGLRAVVFTPATAPETKKAGIRRHGARLRDEAPDYDAAEASARAFAVAEGGLYVSPYAYRDVIAGTIGLEIVEALPDCDAVVVPLGGGGLASGIGLAVNAAAPRIEVIGVEVEASTPFTASLRAGHIVEIVPGPSLADGLTGNLEANALTFPLVRDVVDRIVTVGEANLVAAMRGLAEHEHLIVEGSGATAIAALMAGRIDVSGRTTAAVVTGSNVDLNTWLGTVS
jgi:threonine dehydratase